MPDIGTEGGRLDQGMQSFLKFRGCSAEPSRVNSGESRGRGTVRRQAGEPSLYRRLFEHLPYGVLLLDHGTRRILLATETARAMLDYPLEELLGARFSDFTIETDPLLQVLMTLEDRAAGLLLGRRRPVASRAARATPWYERLER